MLSRINERMFGDRNALKEIKQFAEVVVNFSSQYGNTHSQSYTAANLAGEPRIYSKYGDFQEALVLVRYFTGIPIKYTLLHYGSASYTYLYAYTFIV